MVERPPRGLVLIARRCEPANHCEFEASCLMPGLRFNDYVCPVGRGGCYCAVALKEGAQRIGVAFLGRDHPDPTIGMVVAPGEYVGEGNRSLSHHAIIARRVRSVVSRLPLQHATAPRESGGKFGLAHSVLGVASEPVDPTPLHAGPLSRATIPCGTRGGTDPQPRRARPQSQAHAGHGILLASHFGGASSPASSSSRGSTGSMWPSSCGDNPILRPARRRRAFLHTR
jgi:hypothetical protein